MLILENVSFGYKKHCPVLAEVSCQFSPGINLLLGENGSGKSTLLRICAGILEPWKGKVEVNGKPIEEIKPRIAFSSHFPGLIESYTVKENIKFYMEVKDWKEFPENVVRVLGVEKFMEEKVCELSHGQRKRAALVAALLGEPEVILLDEPTTGLDQTAVHALFKLLQELKDKIIIVSSHDAAAIGNLADRVYLMKQGKLQYLGPADSALAWLRVQLRAPGAGKIFQQLGIEYKERGDIYEIIIKKEQLVEIIEMLKAAGINPVIISSLPDIERLLH
ncbi:MAG: ABC transporter ATP-binding protein [bacterium]|nr:ABC transporter ATP-binding protein [bacterium]